MNCKQTHAMLSSYIDGEMTEQEKAMFEAHLSSCASCRHALEEMQGFVLFVRSLADETLPRDFAANFVIPTAAKEKKKRLKILRTRVVLAAAVFIFLIGAVSILVNGFPQSKENIAGQPLEITEEEPASNVRDEEAGQEDYAADAAQQEQSADLSAPPENSASASAGAETESHPIFQSNGALIAAQGGDFYQISCPDGVKDSVVDYVKKNIPYREYQTVLTAEADEISFYITADDAMKLGENLMEMGILTAESGMRIPAKENNEYLSMTAELDALRQKTTVADTSAGLKEDMNRLTELLSLVKVNISFV